MSIATTRQELPPLRALPVPLAAPRAALTVIRDAPGSTVAPTQGTLAFATPAAAGVGSAPLPGPVEEFVARRPTPEHLLPDPRHWAAQFVQAAVEVATGRRPVTQLVRWTSEDVRALLTRRAALSARRQASRPGAAAGPARRTVVSSARAFQPCAGVVEASVVLADGDRVRAVALRMEGLDGRWRVTALEIG